MSVTVMFEEAHLSSSSSVQSLIYTVHMCVCLCIRLCVYVSRSPCNCLAMCSTE